jgi:hypothetical protein
MPLLESPSIWHKQSTELNEMLEQISDRINEQNSTFDELHHYEIACCKLLAQVQMLKQTYESTKYTPAKRGVQFDFDDEMAVEADTPVQHDDVSADNMTDEKVNM